MNRIVFDFDGTLLDSRRRHIVVLAEAFHLVTGKVITKKLLDGYLCAKSRGMNTYQYLCSNAGLEREIAKLVSDKWRELIELPENLMCDFLYGDSKHCLEELKSTCQLFLISARSREALFQKQVVDLGIKDYFEEIICVSPENAIDSKYAKLIKTKACLVVGDSEIDQEAAIKAGILFYALNRGFRHKSYWESKKVKSYCDLSYIKNILLHKNEQKFLSDI